MVSYTWLPGIENTTDRDRRDRQGTDLAQVVEEELEEVVSLALLPAHNASPSMHACRIE